MNRLLIGALLLLGLGLLVTQVLIGGARMVFAFPGYAVIAAAGLVLLWIPSPKQLSPRQGVVVASGVILALYVILRGLLSPVEYAARPDLFMALAALIVYWATAKYFTGTKERITLIFLLLGAGVVHVVIGVVQLRFFPQYMLIPGIQRVGYGSRASGFYVYPSHLAGLLEMVGFSILGLCCWARWRPVWRLVAGHGAAICFGGLAITGSRGGWVSAIAGLVIFAVLSCWIVLRVRLRRTRTVLAGIVGGAAALIGAFYLFMADNAGIAERLGSIYEPENGRILLWSAALEQFRLAPVFGTGAGTYLFFGRMFRSPEIQGDPVHVHSDYLELLGDYGLVGLCSAIILIALHLASGFGAFRRILLTKLRPGIPPASNELALVVGALSGLGAIFVHSAIDFNFHLPANTLVAAFFLAILAVPSAVTSSAAASSVRRWASGSIAVIPAIAILVAAFTLWPAEFFGEKARVAVRDRQYFEAWRLAEQAAVRDPQNPMLHFYAAEAQHYLTEIATEPTARAVLHEGALSSLDKALALSPRDTLFLLRRAQVLDLLGRVTESEAAYRRTIENDPNLATIYAYFGLHWKRREQFWLARGAWLKASALGESAISGRGLQEIARLKKDPLLQALSPEAFKPIRPADPIASPVR